MLTGALTEPRARPLVLGLSDAVGVCLADLSHRFGAHCLVESDDGAVVGHALRGDDAPPAFTAAVLRRDASCLARPLHERRAVGVAPGGPVLIARLPGWPGQVLSAPLLRGGQRVGWLWLLAPGKVEVDVERVVSAAADAAAALGPAAGSAGEDPFLRALFGIGVLPSALRAPATEAWVAAIRVSPAVTTQDLRLALHGARPRGSVDRLQLVTDPQGERTFGIFLTSGRSAESVRPELQSLAHRASEALPGTLRLALSEPVDPSGSLVEARLQAEAALPHVRDGQCVLVRDLRSRVVLDLLIPVLQNLPELGPDPIATLLSHDERRGSNYVRSMLCWLEVHGDVGCAAELLRVHHNTLRYRLNRARAVLGLDLDDPAVRLEVHLRLRAAARRSTP